MDPILCGQWIQTITFIKPIMRMIQDLDKRVRKDMPGKEVGEQPLSHIGNSFPGLNNLYRISKEKVEAIPPQE